MSRAAGPSRSGWRTVPPVLNEPDADLLALAARLTLQDIEQIERHQRRNERDGLRNSDEELALSLFAQEARSSIMISNDRAIAQALLDADRGATFPGHIPQAPVVQLRTRQPVVRRLPQLQLQPPAAPAQVLRPSIFSQMFGMGSWLFSFLSPSAESTSASGSSSGLPRLTGHNCVICQDPIRGAEVSAPCGHHYDHGCVLDLFRSSTTDESLFPPSCCRRPIPLQSVRSFLPPKLLAQFTDKERELSTTRRVYCANPRCSRFLAPISEGWFKRTLVCSAPGCETRTCSACRRQVTQFSTNSSHICRPDDGDARVLELGRAAQWAQCPACDQLIELAIGCFHMTCRCKTEFCYLCRARWKTCQCPQWDERRLVNAAEARVDAQIAGARRGDMEADIAGPPPRPPRPVPPPQLLQPFRPILGENELVRRPEIDAQIAGAPRPVIVRPLPLPRPGPPPQPPQPFPRVRGVPETVVNTHRPNVSSEQGAVNRPTIGPRVVGGANTFVGGVPFATFGASTAAANATVAQTSTSRNLETDGLLRNSLHESNRKGKGKQRAEDPWQSSDSLPALSFGSLSSSFSRAQSPSPSIESVGAVNQRRAHLFNNVLQNIQQHRTDLAAPEAVSPSPTVRPDDGKLLKRTVTVGQREGETRGATPDRRGAIASLNRRNSTTSATINWQPPQTRPQAFPTPATNPRPLSAVITRESATINQQQPQARPQASLTRPANPRPQSAVFTRDSATINHQQLHKRPQASTSNAANSRPPSSILKRNSTTDLNVGRNRRQSLSLIPESPKLKKSGSRPGLQVGSESAKVLGKKPANKPPALASPSSREPSGSGARANTSSVETRDQLVRDFMARLRVNADCAHSRWRTDAGGVCDTCHRDFRVYIFVCRECQFLACNRCRRNRL